MKKRIINIILILIMITSFGTAGYLLADYYMEKNNPEYHVKKIVKTIKKEEYPKEPIKQEYVNNLPNYRQQYNNEYIKGRLKIPNIQLDTLVTRTDNNNYFLEHNLYNEYDGIGTAIFDFRNDSLSTDRQINIYGHNTENMDIYDKVPFVKLEAYVNEETFNNAQDIYLEIDEKEIHYQVVAVKIISNSDDEHMIIKFNQDDLYQKHIDRLLSNTLYRNENIEITASDKILIIQTCHYNPYDTYLLVIAKEV